MRSVMIVLAALLMVSCTPEPDVARYTVAQYRADVQLRREMLTRCTDDPGTLGKSPDCINAVEAERRESRGSLRDQLPLGLDPVPR